MGAEKIVVEKDSLKDAASLVQSSLEHLSHRRFVEGSQVLLAAYGMLAAIIPNAPATESLETLTAELAKYKSECENLRAQLVEERR